MNRGFRPAAHRRRVTVLAGLALLAMTGSTLAGCAPSESRSERVAPTAQPVYPQLNTKPNFPVTANIEYGDPDGTPILLDVCFPKATADGTNHAPRPAVVAIHGGSWRAGDKADASWRSICQWLASSGFVTFSIDYRLAPAFTFPAQIEDVRSAVSWIRASDQVTRYNIDPDRIGVFGGSAGGNLAALLGTEGSGPLTVGSRVAAVAELSGPTDLTAAGLSRGVLTPGFQQLELDYLHCPSFGDCENAMAASPLYQVDKTDPPFFIGHSINEYIPVQQSDAMVAALRKAGIDVTYVTVKGTAHSVAMLDRPLAARIVAFLHDKLGD